jgi:hypothetical protein
MELAGGQGRRDFLRRAAAGALAVGLAPDALHPTTAAAEPATQPQSDPLPQITIAGVRIPRMVVGCNPIGGWSHQVQALTNAMLEYFTLERTIEFLRRCESVGLDVWVSYWDDKPRQALRRLWSQGSKLRTYLPGNLTEDGKLSKDVLELNPVFYIHHGNVTDNLFREGKQEVVHDFVKRVHDEMGIPAGISAHNPDCIRYAEEKGWEADLYQLCLYYLTRPKEQIRAKLGSAMLGESFLEGDRDEALKVIREVSKPCLAFKILGAGWHCSSPESVEEAFRIALTGIKKTDGIIVGMWPKFKDEISMNLQLLRKYGTT